MDEYYNELRQNAPKLVVIAREDIDERMQLFLDGNRYSEIDNSSDYDKWMIFEKRDNL